MATNGEESFEETAARLGLGGAPPARVPPPDMPQPTSPTRVPRPTIPSRAPQPTGPSPVADSRPGVHLASEPAQRGRGGGLIGVGIAAAVVVAVAVGVAVNLGGGSTALGGTDWSKYPGTSYDDPAEILAAPSLEDVQAKSDAFVADFKARLAEEYDPLWQQEYEGSTTLGSNGYDGDSMTYDYSSPDWMGAAVVIDSGAREHIVAVFQELAAEYGAEDFYISNDLYTEPGDKDTAVSQFGSATRSKQALWSASASEYGLGGLSLYLDVLDTTVPTEDDFSGDYYSRVIELDGGDATLFVTLRISSYTLLSTHDREEFRERTSQYDEKNKP